jgi:hypothetical protein
MRHCCHQVRFSEGRGESLTDLGREGGTHDEVSKETCVIFQSL